MGEAPCGAVIARLTGRSTRPASHLATPARRRSRLVGLALAASLCACAGAHKAPTATTVAAASTLASGGRASQRIPPSADAPARSRRLATISRRATGPFTAYSGDLGVAVWAVGTAKSGAEDVMFAPFAGDGAPLAAPRVVASLTQDVTALVVRPLPPPRGGWVIAWSTLLDRGEAISILAVDADGTPRGSPSDVQRTADHVRWLDAIPTPRGSLCVWAEETSSGEANVLASGVGSDGKVAGLPVRVARGVARWQAAGGAAGAGLALVSIEDKADAGKLTWQRLDADGSPAGAPVAVSPRPSVSSDVDVVSLPDGWLLAWTDRTGEDAQVLLAAVDASGHLRGPMRALDTVGSSSLVALASGARGVVLAWEEPHASTRSVREVHLASVTVEGERLAAKSAITMALAPATSRAPLEVVAADDGFALLAEAHACPAVTPSCAGRMVPTFVRFGPSLEPQQAEPIFLGDDRVGAALGWSLSCAAGRCSALAATSEAPTPVFIVDLAQRSSPYAIPSLPAPPKDASRLAGIATVARGSSYLDLAAAQVGDATLLATLAFGASGEAEVARGGASRTASIVVQALDDGARPLGVPATLSSRAVPVGGVAIAPGARPDDGAALAWVKRDEGDPQVHLARVDRRGRRVREVQLTTAKGEATSVSIAPVPDGWIVAWVDARDGNGEVYAARVDRELNRIGREERITRAPGDAADLTLATHGPLAWLAWSDPRESPKEGFGDIYVAQLRVRDAQQVGEEVHVLATAPHSRSPQIAPTDDGGAIAAWIEDTPTGLDGPGAAMLVRLDAGARVVAGAVQLPLRAGGRPSSIVLSARGGAVRAVVVRSSSDSVTLDAAVLPLDGASPSGTFPLLDLDAPPPFDVAIAFAGDAFFFDDVGVAKGSHRIRRASVLWGRP